MKRRAISMFLVLALVISMMPIMVTHVHAAAAGAGPRVVGGKRDFTWPVPASAKLSSCFLDPDAKGVDRSDYHYALDINYDGSTHVPIVASYGGYVLKVNNDGAGGGFGNYVVLKHSNYQLLTGEYVTLYTRYSHLYSTSVSEGSTISAGTQVGTMGNSGGNYGIHLDFQILYGCNDSTWSSYKTYSIDPFVNDLLEMPSSLNSGGATTACCANYVTYVKQLYSNPLVLNYDISVSNATQPSSITQGSVFYVRGTVNSGAPLTNVTCGVYDINGNSKTSKSVNPGSTSYDLANIDSYITFNTLTPGVYRYQISASNAQNTVTLIDKVFTVLATSDTISSGTYNIKFANNPSLSLDTTGHGTTSGTRLELSADTSCAYREFRITSVGNGYYTITHIASGLCVDVTGAASDDGAVIELYGPNTSEAQLWQILPVGNSYCLAPKCAPASVIDISGTPVSGAKTNLWHANLTNAQLFTLSASAGCAHTYNYSVTTTPTTAASGVLTGTCSKCGLNTTITLPKLTTSDYNYAVTTAATCTANGTGRYTWKTTTYGTFYFDVTIAKLDHTFTSEIVPPTCVNYAGIKYTCSMCGYSYIEYSDVEYSDWSTTFPSGIDASLIESRTEYRYSDYETTTSYNTSMSGWTQKSWEWKQSESGTINYVPSWPGGFSTSHSLYSQYNNTPKTASESSTVKTVINSTGTAGYIYWHWCRDNQQAYLESMNRLIKPVYSSEFHGFHAFFSTKTPAQLLAEGANHDSSDNSYVYRNLDCCKDSEWYFPLEVKSQSYTVYKKLFTYERWTDWSAWSTTPYTASSTRQVETRTVYRYVTSPLGEHQWNSGTITTQPTCTEDGVKTFTCTVCGETKTETVAKLGHDYQAVVTAPTCTEQGYTTHTCSRCGDCYQDTYVDPTGHNFENGVCTICGIKVSAISVDHVNAFPGETVTVPVRITNNGGFAGFTFTISCDQGLTLTEIKKGEVLQASESGSFNANAASGYVTWFDSVGSTADGVILNLKFTVADDAEDGNYVVSVALRDDNETNFVDESSKALPVEFTSGAVEIVQPHTHEYTDEVTPPTCTEQGYTTHTCSCGDTYVDNYTPALGHNFVNGVCTRCGAIDNSKLVVSGATQTTAPGKTITVPVMISGGEPFAGFTMTISASEELTLKSIEKGTLLKDADGMFTKNLAQKTVNWTCSENLIGDGELMVLTFDVSETAADGDLAITLALKDNKPSNMVDADGNPVSTRFDPIIITVSSIIYGDTNSDGEVDTADAVRLVRYLVDLIDLTDMQKLAADVNHDSDLTSADSIRLVRYLVGLVETLDSAPSAQPTRGRTPKRDADGPTVQIGTVAGAPGATLTVPITITGNTGFAGFTLEVDYPEGLTLTKVAKGNLLKESDGGALTSNPSKNLINWNDTENLTGDGQLLVLTFKIGENASAGDYAVSLALKDGKPGNFVDEEGTPVNPTFVPGTVTVNGHEHQYVDIVTPSTCTEQGYTTHTCSICGDSYIDTYTEPLGHDWGEWTVTTPPTPSQPGVETRTCSRCNAAESREVAPIQTTVTVGTVSGQSGETVIVPVTMTGNTGFAGFTLEVVYPESLKLTKAAKGALLKESEGGALTSNPAKNLINWNDTENLYSDGEFLILTFEILETAESGNYQIQLQPKENKPGNFVDEDGTPIAVQYVPGVVCVPAEGPQLPCDGGANCPGIVFSDMPAKEHWAHDAIDWAYVYGVTSGTSSSTFSPNRACSRAQAVTFLWRAAGSPEPTNTNNPFMDVSEDMYYYKAVLWAVENDITTGTSADTFWPNGVCTRAQIVTFLWRSAGSPEPQSSENHFEDVTSGYYVDAVAWANENGITAGTSATTFSPNLICSRSQIVTFLYRCFEK